MQPQPQPKIAQLGEEVARFFNAIAYQGVQLDDAHWQVLFDEVEKLSTGRGPRFIGESYALQAILYSLKLDVVNWKSCVEFAIYHGVDDYFMANVLGTGFCLGEVSYQNELLAEIVERADEPGLLVKLVNLLAERGKFTQACLLASKLRKMDKSDMLLNSDTSNELCSLLPIESSIDESALAERIDVAAKVVVEYMKKPIFRRKICAVDDSYLYYFIVDVSDDELYELEWAIIDKINDQFEDSMSDYISFVIGTPDMFAGDAANVH